MIGAGSSIPTPTGADPGTGDTTTPAPGGGSNIFFFLIIMTVGMFLIMSMSGRKEKKQRAAMLKALGKKDEVRTAGGIIGTVIEMKDDRVLLETDRGSHTRMWLSKGSISSVLKSHGQKSEEKETQPETAS